MSITDAALLLLALGLIAVLVALAALAWVSDRGQWDGES